MPRRRGNGEGSLRMRSNGVWEAAVMVGYKPTGERNIKYFYATTKAEARRKMHTYLDARERGLDVDTDYSLAEWLELYLQLHAPNVKPVTAENYRYTARLAIKELGEKSIKKLRPLDIELLLLRLAEEGRSDSAISQVRGLLYSALHKAVGNGLILNNPVIYAASPRKRPANEKEVFTQDEYKRLLEYLPDNLIGHSLRILVCCGLRSQELLALMPEHIEPDGSAIKIRQAVSMQKGHVTISTPKTITSNRIVPVPMIVRSSAIYLRNTPNQFVWQSDCKQQPINLSTFRKLYKECLESIPGVRYLPPHNCRHSYVSMLYEMGVGLPTVQKLVGHSNLRVSLHYNHIQETVKAEAVEKLSDLLVE